MEAEIREYVVFQEHLFHSKFLIPWDIAVDAADAQDNEIIIKWIDLNPNHKFKKGDEVAHKGNIRQQMFVSELGKDGIIKEDADGTKKKKTMFVGLICHWFEQRYLIYEPKKKHAD